MASQGDGACCVAVHAEVLTSGSAAVQVRSMQDSLGQVSEAPPSIAVQMVGLNNLPAAGDDFLVCSSEAEVCTAFDLPRYSILNPAGQEGHQLWAFNTYLLWTPIWGGQTERSNEASNTQRWHLPQRSRVQHPLGAFWLPDEHAVLNGACVRVMLAAPQD